MKEFLWETRLMFFTVCVLAIAGCQKNTNGPDLDPYVIPGTKLVDGAILKSTVARNDAAAPEADIASIAEANNAFAWAMFNKLFNKDANLVFSPYSISTALSMTWVGAWGQTADEMRQALRLSFGGAQFHTAMDAIERQLESRGQGAGGREGDVFSLKINNTLWGEQTMQFSIHFLDTLACYYDAGMGLCDFINNPDPARLRINAWISGKTNNKISNMLGPGSIDDQTCLVITNTIYFDAVWADTFKHEDTYPGWFHRLGGDSVQVPFMKRTGACNYSEDGRFQALEMPYGGKQVSMVVLLPNDTSFLLSGSAINDTIVNDLLTSFTSKNVRIRMPKFSFTYGTASMEKPLQEMGMRLAFTGKADFSGICDSSLFITDVLHKAFIAVDEKGTTAAAATTVIFIKGAPEYDIMLNVNRPFIFLIRDIPTNLTLFIGYVSDPASS